MRRAGPVLVIASLAALAGSAVGAPESRSAALSPAALVSDPPAAALVAERRAAHRERVRLVRRARAARDDLGELAVPLGGEPRNRWRPFPDDLPREARLRRQLGRERIDRRDVHFWLASNLRASSRLLRLVRNPTPRGNRELASAYFRWEYPCARVIIEGETGGTWRHDVAYGFRYGEGLIYSGLAYGLPQARPGVKLLRAGPDAASNPVTQLRWMRSYATARYGSLCEAAAAWSARGHW